MLRLRAPRQEPRRTAAAAPVPAPATPIPKVERARWFQEHYFDAPAAIMEFLGGDGISLAGRRVADVGCGDGLIDLGLARAADPALLVGFDAVATDTDLLAAVAAENGHGGPLPECLSFQRSAPEHVPAEDHSFDAVVSWSVFEHARDPAGLCREMRRILRPGGVAFIQLWPFWASEHGSHLWEWFPGEGFLQHLHDRAELEARVRANPGPDPEWAEYMIGAHLNRITLDDLQRAVIAAGMAVSKVELVHNSFHVPVRLAHLPLSQLAIGGVKLICV